MKKTTSIFLLICIVLSLLASCAGAGDNSTADTDTTAAETKTETTEETVTEISDNLPEMD